MKNPPVIREVCGTERGYRWHGRHNEERCQPCRTAWNIRCKKYQEKYVGESKPNIAEVIAEIEWFLSLGQGTQPIVKALGYIGKEASLERRLQNHGRHDLAKRLIRGDLAEAA